MRRLNLGILWLIAASLFLTACGSTSSRPDAGGTDGAVRIDAAGALDANPDASTVDALPGDGASAGDATICQEEDAGPTYTQAGYCFGHTPTCCFDAECPSGTCLDNHHCRSDTPCFCIADADCQEGHICLTNETVCGVCLPARPRCSIDVDCTDGTTCINDRCTDTTRCMFP
ncbi:MAG: hypothetical protein IT379_11865 [Deltaproteobacteria bacterium]|nr:hypothetical protein [Deltaproteobacteria bacterium]